MSKIYISKFFGNCYLRKQATESGTIIQTIYGYTNFLLVRLIAITRLAELIPLFWAGYTLYLIILKEYLMFKTTDLKNQKAIFAQWQMLYIYYLIVLLIK